MSRKISMFLAGLSIGLAVLMSGCNPTAELNLKYSSNQTATYKAVSEVVKDYRFEQPNLGKLNEEQSKTAVSMTFTQTIDSVDEMGVATATITIQGLKMDIVNKNETQYTYDSETDDDSPMAQLLGQSYTIQISPNGNIKVINAAAAKASVKSDYEKKLAATLLDNDTIIARHKVVSLPQDSSTLSVNDSWSQTVPSPPGLLAPKNYKKVYTLTDVNTKAGNSIATIEMVASEDAQAPAASKIGSSMGIFARMFDNEDNYTGTTKLDLTTGQVLKMEETLTSTYLAQEMPEQGDPEKGPDTLTMQFTNRILLEKLN